MNTLLALSAPQPIHAFRQNSLWMRSGCAAHFVSSAKPGSGHPGLLARHNLQRPDFWNQFNLASQSCCYDKTLAPSLLCCRPTPSFTVLFPCVKQRRE